MILIDAATVLASPPPQIRWSFEGLVPEGTDGDEAGGPGVGKTTITKSMVLAVASATGNWFNLKCTAGKVMLLGGECSSSDSFSRDLHRSIGNKKIDPGMLHLAKNDKYKKDADYIFHWNRDDWELTDWGQEVTDQLVATPHAMVVLDTTLSVCRGYDPLNIPQQYSLGTTIRSWGDKLGDPFILSLSHTNQASNSEQLDQRLSYLSRAGGNGLPGSLRWLAGVSRLKQSDKLASGLKLAKQAENDWLIAFGVSKANEMPRAVWNDNHPAIFQIRLDGQLVMLMDGKEVKERLSEAEPAANDDPRPYEAAKAKSDRYKEAKAVKIGNNLGIEVRHDAKSL